MSVRQITALSAAVICLLVLTLGASAMRHFVALHLSAAARQTTAEQLDRMAAAYRAAGLGGGRAALAGAGLRADAVFEVVTDTGRTVVRSADLRRLDPSWRPLPPAPAGSGPGWRTTAKATLRPGPGGHPQWREYRTYTVLGRVVENVPAAAVEPLGRAGHALDAGQHGPARAAGRSYRLTLYLFVLPWDTFRTEKLFDNMLATLVPLAVLVTAAAAWFAAGRALRPVEAIRRELAEVSEAQLFRRVPVPRSRDEIAKLAVTTNATLDRLERSYQQQERFVADASHELRTPLASLRTGLEVALAHSDRVDWPRIARRSLLDLQRLQRITTDLLQLAVAPAESPAPRSVVDLADVAREQVAERAHAAGGPAVVCRSAPTAPVLGEPVQLERLLRNLLDNAVRHARSEVTVRVVDDPGAPTVVLDVLDDGPGIPVAERERVFDRFARLDDSRARDAGGSGLGLTIARDIAVRHGGSLRVEESATGARLVARLPRTAP